MTILERAIEDSREFLTRHGVVVTYDATGLPRSCSANLDSDELVGTITHWPTTRFEFQFNNACSGEVVVLEEIETEAVSDVSALIRDLYTDRRHER